MGNGYKQKNKRLQQREEDLYASLQCWCSCFPHWSENVGCALTRREVTVDFIPLRSSHQGGRRRRDEDAQRFICLLLRVRTEESEENSDVQKKKKKSPAGINALPHFDAVADIHRLVCDY